MAFRTTQTSDQDPGGPAEVAIPQPNPITQERTPLTKVTNNVQAGSSGKSGGGIGDILGPVASILGGLFSEGGLVTAGDKHNGFADGGYVPNTEVSKMAAKSRMRQDQFSNDAYDSPNDNDDNTSSGSVAAYNRENMRDFAHRSNNNKQKKNEKGYADGGMIEPPSKNDSLAKGYLVGAYHQKMFGGDPVKLPDAAAYIKQLLDQGPRNDNMGTIEPPPKAQGYASGGAANPGVNQPQQSNVNTNPSEALNALLKALDTGNGASNGSVSTDAQSTQNQLPVTNPQQNPTQQGYMDQLNQSQVQTGPSPAQINMNNDQMSGDPNQMRGYAMGGSPMMAPPGGPIMAQQPIPQNTIGRGYAAGGPPQSLPQGMPMGTPSGGPPSMGDPNANTPPLQPGQSFQGDGSVKGPGGPQDDAIPAKLSDGEFVFAQPAVQFFGVDKLTKMNEQGKQGFMQAMSAQQPQQPSGPAGAPPQPQTPPGPPMGGPPGMPPQQPPMAHGGAVMRTKGSGYCGI